MITVTLPKSQYDNTQNEIKELKEKIAKILEQKGSFVLKGTQWHPFGEITRYIFVENCTNEEKEILLTKEIAALNLKLENIKKSRDEYYTMYEKSDRLANSRLEMIRSLQKDLDLLTDKKVIPSTPNMIKENGGSTNKPWWKLF